jgi:hypothetical protein
VVNSWVDTGGITFARGGGAIFQALGQLPRSMSRLTSTTTTRAFHSAPVGPPASGGAGTVVRVPYDVHSVTAVGGGLALGMNAGLLVLEIPATPNFFISFTGPDRPWAEWIAWELEQTGHSVTIQAWDFRPGSDFVVEMERALAQAGRVLAVLSPAYLASPFAMAEWRAAFAGDPQGATSGLSPYGWLTSGRRGCTPRAPISTLWASTSRAPGLCCWLASSRAVPGRA